MNVGVRSRNAGNTGEASVPLGLGVTRDNTVLVVIISVILGFLFKGVLDQVYNAYVIRVFPDMFESDFQGLLVALESYLICAVLTATLCYSLHRHPRPSGVILVLQYLMVVMPLLTLYTFGQVDSSFLRLCAASLWLLVVVTHALPRLATPAPGRSVVAAGWILLCSIAVYVYGSLLLNGASQWLAFDFAGVYSVREHWTSLSWPLLGYLVPWQGNAINPALLAWSMHEKRWGFALIVVVLQVLLYGMTGQKSFLLAVALVMGVYAIYKFRSRFRLLLLGASGLVCFAYLIYLVTGNQMVPSVFIRRLFFVPGMNHAIYFDFFSDPSHPHILLSNSILAPLVEYPYDMPVTRVISWAYWGRDFSPNVGYLGDAYAHFGGLGMILFSAVLAFVLRVVDSLRSADAQWLVAAMITVPGMALVNSALLTTLLTHGFLPAMLIVWFLPARRELSTNRSGGLLKGLG